MYPFIILNERYDITSDVFYDSLMIISVICRSVFRIRSFFQGFRLDIHYRFFAVSVRFAASTTAIHGGKSLRTLRTQRIICNDLQ